MSDERVASSELLAARRAKLEALRAEGVDPFPHEFDDVETIAAVRAAHASLQAGEETTVSHRVAGRLSARRGQGKMAFLDLVDRSGRIQLQARVDELGAPGMDRLLGLDLGDLIGIDGTAFMLAPWRADAADHVVRRAGEVAAAAAGEASRADRRRDPLPPPRARPDRERGGARAVHDPRPRDLGRAAVPRRRGFHRGRDPGAAATLWRRAGATVHHPPQRARSRVLPADRDRALPQAADRRRPRARLRARQGLPQRGRRHDPQPRVHDARVVRGVRRLREDRRALRAPGLVRGRRRSATEASSTSLRRGAESGWSRRSARGPASTSSSRP